MGLVRAAASDPNRKASDAAFDQVIRSYSDKLLPAGRRHCRTNEEAEDAEQDALMTAAEKLGGLGSDTALAPRASRAASLHVRVVASACRRLGRGRKNTARLHD